MTFMKKLISCTVAGLIALTLFTNQAFAAPPTHVLNVISQTQSSGSSWCWAACTASSVRYKKGWTPAMSDIVASVFGSPNPNQGATINQVKIALSIYGVTSTATTATVGVEINIYNRNSPIIAGCLSLNTGAGHMVLIRGYYPGSVVEFMDPANGTFYTVNLSSFLSNTGAYRYKWIYSVDNMR